VVPAIPDERTLSINSNGRFFFFASLVGGSDQFGVFWDEPVK
jgi:hypothetical protein